MKSAQDPRPARPPDPTPRAWTLLTLSLFLLLSIQIGCGEDSTNPAGEPVTWIRGRVHTIPDVRRGTVRLDNFQGTPHIRVEQTLDIDGNFAIPVPAGIYQIRLEMPDNMIRYYVRRDGTLSASRDSIAAVEGTETELDISLGSLLITLDHPEGYDNDRISLFVNTESGAASYRRSRVETRQTYRLGHLAPGSYGYQLRLGPGYPSIQLALDGIAVDTLQVRAGEELAYDGILPLPAWIEFDVSDPDEVVAVSIESYPLGEQWRTANVGAGSNRVAFAGADSVLVRARVGVSRFLTPMGPSVEPIPLVLSRDEDVTLPVNVARLIVSPQNSQVSLGLYDEEGQYQGSVSLGSNPLLWGERFYGRIEPRPGDPTLGASHWIGGVARRTDSELLDLSGGIANLTWKTYAGGTVRGHLAEPAPFNQLITYWRERKNPDIRRSQPHELGPDGRAFELSNAPIGEFYLETSVLGFRQYYPGVSTPDSAEVIVIESGATIDDVDFLR